jgi:hypothetical protein
MDAAKRLQINIELRRDGNFGYVTMSTCHLLYVC